jgi:hypothetical protein
VLVWSCTQEEAAAVDDAVLTETENLLDSDPADEEAIVPENGIQDDIAEDGIENDMADGAAAEEDTLLPDEDICQTVEDECDIATFIDRCAGYNRVLVCESTPCGNKITEHICDEGSGCVKGVCVADQCTDECIPGETDNFGNVCGYYDIKTGSWREHDADNALHDRARQYLWWTDTKAAFQGYLTNFYYKDPPDYNTPDFVAGVGDTAIWTGTYLGSEALRYMTTGDYSAEKHMESLIIRMHRLFKISGVPAILSRFAIKTAVADSLTYSFEQDCNDTSSWHCNVPYEGELWNYSGHISRDQYQGFVFGFSLAYSALPHREDLRAIIRNDIIELADELMKLRQINLEVRIDNIPVDHPKVELGLSVLIPQEMAGGGTQPIINYCHAEGPNCANTMQGMLEFIPDISELLKQINVLSWVPQGIPRADSAIMVMALFNIAIDMTRNVPGFEEKYNELMTFYYAGTSRYGNAQSWKDMAQQWFFTNACWDKYYGINIAMEPMYNLMRLEQNADLSNFILANVLEGKIWEKVKTHKNSFFAYIYLSGKKQTITDVVTTANAQLSQFMPPPKYRHAVDLSADPAYLPFQSDCANYVNESNPVDVQYRAMDDFIWQRQPFTGIQGEYKGVAYAGTDFVTAYWMARYHGFLEEDTSGTCLRWKTP